MSALPPSRRSFCPSRLFIIATPAGAYLTIRLSPEYGWANSAMVGAVVLVLILLLPSLGRSAVKATAAKKTPTQKKS